MSELEEKAEEYLENKSVWKNGKTCVESIRQAYKDGYEQGQKEDKNFCENFCMKGGKIAELEKENEELKGYESCINDFKAEGFDSAMSVKEYCRNYAKLLKENEELKEKMKCCGNCKHYSQESNYTIGVCKEKYDVEGNNICDNWELVE